MPISRISAPAPPSAYSASLGGTPLISLIAFSAASRALTFGFSSFSPATPVNMVPPGVILVIAGTFSGGGGGAMYTSFSGGSSEISEKLVLPPALAAPSAIMGSTAILGAVSAVGSKVSISGASATAEDM